MLLGEIKYLRAKHKQHFLGKIQFIPVRPLVFAKSVKARVKTGDGDTKEKCVTQL